MKSKPNHICEKSLQAGRRRGATIIVAMAALTVVTGMIVPLVPPALRARRQCQVEEVALQAEMLRHAAFQFGVLHWTAETESMEKRGTVPLHENGSVAGEWSVKIDRLDETERYRMEIVTKVHSAGSDEVLASPIDQVQSRYEIEMDRLGLESRQKRLQTDREKNARSGPDSNIRSNSINNN
ncbi:hypothetical protein VN12_09815 [Pirellula sp. SH-Sr6A]|uniref:hypothetical protein n=1 Tax=Pirellula sp. SH-Sr6A TaxID=1632865 RepID=UPI00078D3EBB|nr:hypothetical protein [Pirellula sp. SH-Sr6A]AMV32410.1 hypothetical protein VN12_09815 [Pirellula sp. SH-Sr6A]